jgi:hypothetical protein
MQDNKADVRFIGFNKYTKLPVKENTAQNWVQNGRDNGNYKYIIDRNNGSTTNRAINNAYTDLAYGRGLSIHDVEDDSEQTKELFKLINKKDLRAILSDNQVFSAHSIVIHRQKGDKNKLAKIEHIEKSNVIPAIKNEDDDLIHSYFYSEDWTRISQAEYVPVEYPAFGFGKEFNYELPEIYVAKPYQVGQIYFEQAEYDACLQYAQVEEELSNYYVSHILNGLSFGSIVNVPNSKMWSEKQKQDFMDATRNKLGGSSNANRQAFNFKAGESEDTTITNVENNTAHKQWEFLGTEASSKILSGHKCMSPALVGLSSSTGFASVADEMNAMEEQLMKRVISPKQDFVLDSISEIFEFFGLEFDMYFRPLTEIEGLEEEKGKVNEIDDEGNEVVISAPIDEENLKAQAALRGSVGGVTGILGIQESVSEGRTDFNSAVTILIEIYGFSRDVSIKLLGNPEKEEKVDEEITLAADCNCQKKKSDLDLFLELGEDEDLENFDLLDDAEVDYEEEDRLELASTGTARPNSKSSQDGEDFVVRYKYVGSKTGERDFCNKMLKANKLYRKEDILQLSNKAVNKGFGKDGADTYSIWLYKGGGLLSGNFPGGTCKHKWNRVIYLKKGKSVDVNSPLAKTISTSKARQQGFKIKTNDSKVSIAPHDM